MPKAVLSEKIPVTSADTDVTQNLKPAALINMFIQVAWHHADQLGFGEDFLHSNGLIWMLSRMHIKFDRFPAWNHSITINSWPKGIRRLFYLRDFEATDDEKRAVARATSEWLIIHREARRPKLYNPDHNVFRENASKNAMETEVPSLKTPDGQLSLFERTVEYSDIDLNQHLTTTRYIDWMLDCFDMEFLVNNSCRELIVNFIREIPYHRKVCLRQFQVVPDRSFLFEFVSTEDGTLFFRGQVNF